MAGRKGNSLPDSGPIMDASENFAPPWANWFSLTDRYASSVAQSGITADRPTSNLWIGRFFYDTTINKPVYVSAVNPTVWRDAAGVVV